MLVFKSGYFDKIKKKAKKKMEGGEADTTKDAARQAKQEVDEEKEDEEEMCSGKKKEMMKKGKGQNKVHKVMSEFKRGTLKTHGKPVKSREQAIAIAMSEAGLSNKSFDNNFSDNRILFKSDFFQNNIFDRQNIKKK